MMLTTRKTSSSCCEKLKRCGSATRQAARANAPRSRAPRPSAGRCSGTLFRSEEPVRHDDQDGEHEQQPDDVGDDAIIERGDECMHEAVEHGGDHRALETAD